MNQSVLAGMFCLLVPGAAEASGTSGITGSGSLRPVTKTYVTSSDGRFQMDANLQRAPATVQQTGQFSLTAKLIAAAPSAICSPVGDIIFRNGFE